MKVLITGSSGLIGSEAVRYYDALGHQVIGIDNNMRALFFGPSGDTTWNLRKLQGSTRNFTHYDIDICNRERLFALFQENAFDFVIHCAAQPSHDRLETSHCWTSRSMLSAPCICWKPLDAGARTVCSS